MIDPKELAAIRERDADVLGGGLTYMSGPEAMADRTALLAHIDAITEAVEQMRTYPFKEAPYGDEPHAMVLQSAVLALLRGTPQ